MDSLLSASLRNRLTTQNMNITQSDQQRYNDKEYGVVDKNTNEVDGNISANGVLVNDENGTNEEDSNVSVNTAAAISEESSNEEDNDVSATIAAVGSEESTNEENSISANVAVVGNEESTNEENSVSANGVVDNSLGGEVVHDRLKLVFLIFVLHGIGTTTPWNMFMTDNSYFVDFKLNVKGSGTEEIRKNFLIYVGIAANVPNVIFNALNIFVDFEKETLGFRIVTALIIELILFLLTLVLAMVNTTSWVWIFFGITITSVVLINIADGVYQNSVFGLAAKLPMEYTMAVIFGTNISGVITAIIFIISLETFPNTRTAAIYYFITALVVLLACIDTYLTLKLNKFYRYYDTLSKTPVERNAGKSLQIPYKQIFLKVWPQFLNVFLVLFVSSAIFPAICAEIKPVDAKFFVSEKYFTPVTCFLSYNLFATVGSFLPHWFKWPGPKHLWIPAVLRFLLIPLFMFCNYMPATRSLSVRIKSDWAYILMVAFLALSTGHCSSLAMMYAPKYVEKEIAAVTGMMAAFFLILGEFFGVNFTFVVRWLVHTV